MALNVEETNNAAPQQTAQQQFGSNTGPSSSAGQQQVRRVVSDAFGDIGAISVNRGHANMLALRDAVQTHVKEAEGYEFTFIPTPSNIDLAGFILVGRFVDDKSTVAFQTVLIAGTAKNPELARPFTENINGTQVQITRLPSDYYDTRMREIAGQAVRNAFPSCKVLQVSCEVLPVEFNVKDESVVRELAASISAAVVTELHVRCGKYTPVDLSKLQIERGLTIEQVFSNTTKLGIDSMPIRSSVLIEMLYNAKPDRRSLNDSETSIALAHCSGFVDALYLPAPGAQINRGAWVQQQQQGQAVTQCFVPRFVLTDVFSGARTTERILLAIASASTIRENNNWMQAFKPQGGARGKLNLYDVGALNIDANLRNDPGLYGAVIDTNAPDFTLGDLGQIINLMFRSDLVFSMDVPDAGPQTWYTDVFVGAAHGDAHAYNEVYHAANALTGNRFEKHFPHGTAMFVSSVTNTIDKIHLGYWIDSAGEKRDIRDFDYTAVCNLVGQLNPELVGDWSDTWTRTDVDYRIRLEARRNMIDRMSSETAVFTGYGERLTFTAQFVNGFAAAIAETGLPVSVRTPLSSSDFNNQRGVASWANSALLGSGQNTFSQVMNNSMGFTGFNAFAGRWGN